jgi:hypothetical protein
LKKKELHRSERGALQRRNFFEDQRERVDEKASEKLRFQGLFQP